MKAEKLNRRLQWYKITGHVANDAKHHVIAYVEATSKLQVLRYHGGTRKQTQTGIIIQFPINKNEVELLGKRLEPENIEATKDTLVEVVPVHRYSCPCGQTHVSEHPYPYVWCSCGRKVLPENKLDTFLNLS